MVVFIAADHNGFELKKELLEQLGRAGYQAVDAGDKVLNPEDDFPQFAAQAITSIKTSKDDDPRAVLICGSGQGMCMAANRYKGIRASLVWSLDEARASRNDDDSNVLCLPARYMDSKQALELAIAWLSTPFAGAPRFKRRIQQLDQLG